MKFLFSLLSFCFVSSRLHDVDKGSVIIDANSTILQEMVKKFSTLSVLFYAPWCGHCKMVMPLYEKACMKVVSDISTDTATVGCAKVDCTQNEELCRINQISGYPTFKSFGDQPECVYKGQRSEDGIFVWVRSTHFSNNDVSKSEDVNRIVDSSAVTVVGFFVDPQHPLREIGRNVPCEMPDINYLTTSSQDAAKQYDFDEENKIYVLQDGKLLRKIPGASDATELSLLLFFNLNPRVPEYRHDNTHTIFNKGISKYLCFVYENESQLVEYSQILEDYADKRFGDVRVFTTNAEDKNNRNVVDYFKVKKFPMPVFYHDKEERFYHYTEGEITVDKLDTFVHGCLDGSVKHFVRSQPVPEGWEKEPVKEIVVDNMDEAFKLFKSGVVLYYAPWCGHCKSLMPTWMKIGDYFTEKHKDIFVGRLDHTENDISDILIEGYPTIVVYKTQHEKIVYKGDRNYEEILNFIIKHLVSEEAVPSEPKEVHTEL